MHHLVKGYVTTSSTGNAGFSHCGPVPCLAFQARRTLFRDCRELWRQAQFAADQVSKGSEGRVIPRQHGNHQRLAQAGHWIVSVIIGCRHVKEWMNEDGIVGSANDRFPCGRQPAESDCKRPKNNRKGNIGARKKCSRRPITLPATYLKRGNLRAGARKSPAESRTM